jgi:hypothetical protein
VGEVNSINTNENFLYFFGALYSNICYESSLNVNTLVSPCWMYSTFRGFLDAGEEDGSDSQQLIGPGFCGSDCGVLRIREGYEELADWERPVIILFGEVLFLSRKN